MLGSLLRKTPINKNLPYKCKGNRDCFWAAASWSGQACGNKTIALRFPMSPCANIHQKREQGYLGGWRWSGGWAFLLQLHPNCSSTSGSEQSWAIPRMPSHPFWFTSNSLSKRFSWGVNFPKLAEPDLRTAKRTLRPPCPTAAHISSPKKTYRCLPEQSLGGLHSKPWKF